MFDIGDARTLFTGRISRGGKGLIGACLCELVIDGTAVARFKLEAEGFHRSPEGWRSLSTLESVDTAAIKEAIGRCFLRGVELGDSEDTS